MNQFVNEFKTFINRGNVIDMAVGIMVGSSFTAVVNGLSNNVLKPVINYTLVKIVGTESLSQIYTMLLPKYNEANELDLAQSIYIDWGAFISAVLNFLLIAAFLFSFVKLVNKIRKEQREWAEAIADNTLSRADRKELKRRGVKLSDRKAVRAYIAEREAREAQEALEAKLEAERKAAEARAANPTVEDLLKDIRELLRKESV